MRPRCMQSDQSVGSSCSPRPILQRRPAHTTRLESCFCDRRNGALAPMIASPSHVRPHRRVDCMQWAAPQWPNGRHTAALMPHHRASGPPAHPREEARVCRWLARPAQCPTTPTPSTLRRPARPTPHPSRRASHPPWSPPLAHIHACAHHAIAQLRARCCQRAPAADAPARLPPPFQSLGH